ncbi:MAG: MnmC family methyltransferase [Verrucomicrobiia bacterium]
MSKKISDKDFLLVRLPNGEYSLRSISYGETFHPVVGPVTEARSLYLKQLNLAERISKCQNEFVIWDVGLGAAANPVSILECSKNLTTPLRIISFDYTIEPLEFALQHTSELQYLKGWENILYTLIQTHRVSFINGKQPVVWEFHKGDFPSMLNQFLRLPSSNKLPAPCSIFYDAYSPKTNPQMWTLSVFKNLYALLDPSIPCSLATYSRSTLIRATLLLSGFFVGIGNATGEKEETTIAANRIDLIPVLLDKRWLFRAKRSTSAHPLINAEYIQKPISSEIFDQLLAHPQFAHQPI